MLSKLITRILPIFLIFVSSTFAVAPGWIAKGVVLDYSMGGDKVSFTVTERTAAEMKFEIKTSDIFKATENTSLPYGQFWFDNTLLEDASKGDDIEEFEVTAVGSQTFAGKQWDTVTMEATISGAETTRVYDRDSGLMLKQTVQVSGVPEVALTKYVIPDFEAVAPPPPETAPEPTEPTEPTEPSQPEPEEEVGQPYVPPTDTTTPARETPVAPAPEEEEGACLGAILLAGLLGFVFVRG